MEKENMNNLKLNIKTVEGETITIDIVKEDSTWDLKVNVLKRSESKSGFINKLIFDGECEDNSVVFLDPDDNDKTNSPFPKLSEPPEEITTYTYKMPMMTSDPTTSQEAAKTKEQFTYKVPWVTSQPTTSQAAAKTNEQYTYKMSRMSSEPTTSQAAAKTKEQYSMVAIKEPPKANYAGSSGSSYNSSEEDIRYFFKDFAHRVKIDNKEEEKSNPSIKLLMRPKELTYGFSHGSNQLSLSKEFEKNKLSIQKRYYGHTPLMEYDVNVKDPLEALRNNIYFVRMLPVMKRTPEIIGAVLRKICNECPPMLSIIRENEEAVLAMLTDDLTPLAEKHSE